ncbi:MAG: hypothetical protein U0X91_08895 [Spirosomataceae bacterium]
MNQTERTGKKLISILFTVALLLSVIIIVVYNIRIGHENIIPQTVRTLFSALMMLLTYQGQRWAKWILAAIYTFGAVILFTEIGESEYKTEIYINGFLFNFYIIFIFFLLFSKPVSAFLKYQEEKEKQF